MNLKISKDLALPLDAVTQTFAILAMRRKGKTYTASVMAEEMVKSSVPFVVLDPTGAWWGLRAGADGKSEGLPVVIIGGEHGDVPLEPTAGKVIADLVVDHPGFYVIDLSSTDSNAEQDRFATAFAERLYRRKNKIRTPLHIFVDEADSFAPQQPLDGQRVMLGAFEAMIRRGGIRGIGMTLITQRPAVLNKNVLTQCEALIVLQMSAPQDQDAVKEWIRRNGTEAERDTMMQSLASLQVSEAWFWSPSWLRTFKKIRVRQRDTFNSSATPKAGEKMTVPQKLAPVDLAKLGKEIAETIERAGEADPLLLKRKLSEAKQKISKLEQQLAVPAKVKVETKTETKIEKVEVPVLTTAQEGLLMRISEVCTQMFDKLGEVSHLGRTTASLRQDVLTKLAETQKLMARAALPTKQVPYSRSPVVQKAPVPPVVHSIPDAEDSGESGQPNKCQRAILTCLMQYEDGKDVRQVALITGYRISGAFTKSIAGLRRFGYINTGQPMRITEAGKAILGDWTPLPTGQDLLDHWVEKLPKCGGEILRALASIYPEGLSTSALAEQTNYKVSGAFTKMVAYLRACEVISSRQPITASHEFFEA